MSHQEKQEIFDKYASQFEEFGNFEGMINSMLSTVIHKEELIYRIFECCDLVQEEQQKRIAESITMKYHDGSTKKDSFIEYYQIGDDNITVDKSSIINPENKIQ